MRRLRSALRAFRPWLASSVRRRAEKRLKALARSTNRARDAEVQLAWLSDKGALIDPRQRAGLDWLVRRLECASRPEEEAKALLETYRRVSAKLGAKLEVYQSHLRRADPNGSFANVLAILLREQLAVLKERLGEVRGPEDRQVAHEARIEAKRLRYLLEPLKGNPHADVRVSLKHLKRLQDVLGDLNDAFVLADEILTSAASAGAERAGLLHMAGRDGPLGFAALRRALGPNPRAGLLALDRLVRAHRDALLLLLEREVEGGGLYAASMAIEGVAAALENRAAGEREIDRRYLLSGLPPGTSGAPALEILEGWLVGEQVCESVRRVRGPDGERYYRTLRRRGSGLAEAEEELAKPVFEGLWPLTGGRRLERRRYRLLEAGIAWDIDSFADRALVLAVARLPAFASAAPPPEWLRPLVVRDVTDDSAYGAEALALGSPAGPAGSPVEKALKREETGLDEHIEPGPPSLLAS